MEINSIREFELTDGSTIPLTVVRDLSTYRENETVEPQLVRTFEVRAFGSLNDIELIDVETSETWAVTKINTKMGFTYLTLQERNLGF